MKSTLLVRALCALIYFTLYVGASRPADKPNILLNVTYEAFWLGIQK